MPRIAPTSLVTARVELHYAAQIVAACADAWLPERVDDGHTAMQWNSPVMQGERSASGVAVGLRASDLALVASYGDTTDTLPLAGRTITEALAWADQRFGAPRGAHLRDYDLPESPLRGDAPFVGHAPELAELVRYYDLGLAVCARYGECRIWPHHFDLGALVGQAGIGLSPGDRYYGEPYFYMTPAPGSTKVPALTAGFWRTEGWTGAVLPASAFAGDPEIAHAFMAAALTS